MAIERKNAGEVHLMNRDELELHIRETTSRKDSYAAATIDQQSLLKAKDVVIARLEGDAKRLAAELIAANTTARMLGEELATGNDAANREVQRLRELCIANNVDPNI